MINQPSTGMRMLRRLWIRFSPLPDDSLSLGCGVTAYDYDDAVTLLKDRVFPESQVPEVIDVTENVDLSTLDQGRVIPNMEVPYFRVVWFPKVSREQISN